MAAPAKHPEEGPFHASVTLGRVMGVEIGINWSWLVVFGLVVWSLGAAVFPEENKGLADGTYAAMAVVAAILFFASLLLHELGHAAQARRDGMEIEGITLWLFGGVARFKGMFPSAGAELRIALAGPAVSLVLGAVFAGAAKLLSLPAAVDGVLTWLGRINLILLVFNMLPALPLDGGRVFRALAWQATGDFARATRVAGGVGRAIGQAMIFGGILLVFLVGAPGGIWLALIGWFLAGAAAAEARYAEVGAILKGLTVRDAMVSDPVTVSTGLGLDRFMDEVHAAWRYSSYPVLDADGRPAGLVTFRGAAAVPAGALGSDDRGGGGHPARVRDGRGRGRAARRRHLHALRRARRQGPRRDRTRWQPRRIAVDHRCLPPARATPRERELGWRPAPGSSAGSAGRAASSVLTHPAQRD